MPSSGFWLEIEQVPNGGNSDWSKNVSYHVKFWRIQEKYSYIHECKVYMGFFWVDKSCIFKFWASVTTYKKFLLIHIMMCTAFVTSTTLISVKHHTLNNQIILNHKSSCNAEITNYNTKLMLIKLTANSLLLLERNTYLSLHMRPTHGAWHFTCRAH